MSLSMSYIEHIQSPTLTRGNIHMYYMYTYVHVLFILKVYAVTCGTCILKRASSN